MKFRDDSWAGVGVVGGALAAVAVAVIFLWLQVAPQAPAAVETYWPLPDGASFLYRVTHPDGAVTYRSRNVQRLPAHLIINVLDANSFDALMQALQIDLNAMKDMQVMELVRRLARFDAAVIRDVEYDQTSQTLERTQQFVIIHPQRIEVFAVGDASILPPLPLLDLQTSARTVTGQISAAAVFTMTMTRQALEMYAAEPGILPNCLRVQQALDLAQSQTSSVAIYCAGAGETVDETSSTGETGVTRSELIAANFGPFLRGHAPALMSGDVRAALGNVFDNSLGVQLQPVWNYQEPTSSNGVTTRILPVGDLLLYGVSSGALTALERTTTQEQWRFQTGGAIYSTPLVAGSRVFFGSADKKVYAVRLADGAFEWAFETQDVVSAAPAFDAQTVYAASEDKRLYALDAATGQLRWSQRTGSPLIAAPVVHDGVVFASNSAGLLYAFDAASGRILWTFAAEKAITAPVTPHGDLVFVASLDGFVYALQRSNGDLVWKTDLDDEIGAQPIVQITQGEVRIFVTLSNTLGALRAADGSVVWRYRDENMLKGAPLLMGAQVWQLTQTDLIGLNAVSGARETRIETTDSSPNGGLSSDGRTVFAAFFDGALIAYEGEQP